MRLVLFDLDGTLLDTQGAGLRAMARAGAELFGPDFHFGDVSAAGQLDSHLFEAAASRCRLDLRDPRNEAAFRGRYADFLEQELARGEPAAASGVRTLPGVPELLQALAEHPRVIVGLLTGNYATTGRLKLRAAGIDPDRFEVAAFGDDGAQRSDLVPVALGRCEASRGVRPEPHQVVIVGDTPRDVEAARSHGCRCLAVATGPFRLEPLREAGPDVAVQDLSDPGPLWRLLELPAQTGALDGG